VLVDPASIHRQLLGPVNTDARTPWPLT
jgi:hypothetical protein